MTRSPQTNQSKSVWRFGIILALQLAIALAVPLPKAIVQATGTTIALRTVPVDPYDILRGRYVTLDYAAERMVRSGLPGWDDVASAPYARSRPIYLTLEPDPEPPPSLLIEVWHPVAVSLEPPRDLARGQKLIKAHYRQAGRRFQRGVDLGLSQYFIPEERGDALEKDMNANRDATAAEIKVDRRGNSVLVKLWVEDRSY